MALSPGVSLTHLIILCETCEPLMVRSGITQSNGLLLSFPLMQWKIQHYLQRFTKYDLCMWASRHIPRKANQTEAHTIKMKGLSAVLARMSKWTS